MEKWHFEKKSKHTKLKLDCKAQGWTVHDLYVEVGCRRYVYGESFNSTFRTLGFTKGEKQQLKQTVEQTALLCSYLIWADRYRKWEERPLLDVSQ